MSFLTTRSLFYYGQTISAANYALDFNEGGLEIQASLRIGSYSLTELAVEIQDAMNAVGGQVYTVTVNRTTRQITISAPGTFALLAQTGTRTGVGVWVTAGFTTTSNKTGTNTYTSENGSGSEYRPQAVLKDYIGPDDFKVKEFAKVNVAASGAVQVVEFGTGNRIEMNIWLVSDRTNAAPTVEVQANAVANTRLLLDFMITKGKFEFMPNRATPGVYSKCILEKSPESAQGTSYILEEMKAKDFYQTGRLQLRVMP